MHRIGTHPFHSLTEIDFLADLHRAGDGTQTCSCKIKKKKITCCSFDQNENESGRRFGYHVHLSG